MRNVAVLSHIADIDGVGAAALVRMRYGMPLSHIFFTGHSRGEVADACAELRGLSGSGVLLFITDLSPNAETIGLYGSLISRTKSNGGSVVWLDHHVWLRDAIRNLAGRCDIAVFGENSKMCATQLVKRFLRLNSRFASEFADNVHYIDLFISTSNRKYVERAELYKLAIAYYLRGGSRRAQQSRLRKLAAAISSGRFITPEVRRDALKFKKVNEERLKLLFSSMVRLSDSIVLGFSRQVDSNDACMGMLAKSGADISILVKTDTGHCSIRSVKADTLPLANALGGGGHPHASGFSLDVRRYNRFRSADSRKRVAELIARKARSAGLL